MEQEPQGAGIQHPSVGVPWEKPAGKATLAICRGECQRWAGRAVMVLLLGLLGLRQPVCPDCAWLSSLGSMDCVQLSVPAEVGVLVSWVRIEGGLAKAALVQ